MVASSGLRVGLVDTLRMNFCEYFGLIDSGTGESTKMG